MNGTALAYIKVCDDWYANREIEDFHKRKNLNNSEVVLRKMNFAKRCCADDANLCEVVSVSPDKESGSQEFIEKFMAENRFDIMYREQLEKTAATGTVGAYIYLRGADYIQKGEQMTVRGGEVRINYCDADCIVPLTVENKCITECAFSGTDIVKGKKRTILVMFTLQNGLYQAETVEFDETGKEVSQNILQLGEVKPFAIMENAEVNNLDDMEGYGLPKI